jgi:hypothetical protein
MDSETKIPIYALLILFTNSRLYTFHSVYKFMFMHFLYSISLFNNGVKILV